MCILSKQILTERARTYVVMDDLFDNLKWRQLAGSKLLSASLMPLVELITFLAPTSCLTESDFIEARAEASHKLLSTVVFSPGYMGGMF
jgi:hypothetical protein